MRVNLAMAPGLFVWGYVAGKRVWASKTCQRDRRRVARRQKHAPPKNLLAAITPSVTRNTRETRLQSLTHLVDTFVSNTIASGARPQTQPQPLPAAEQIDPIFEAWEDVDPMPLDPASTTTTAIVTRKVYVAKDITTRCGREFALWKQMLPFLARQYRPHALPDQTRLAQSTCDVPNCKAQFCKVLLVGLEGKSMCTLRRISINWIISRARYSTCAALRAFIRGGPFSCLWVLPSLAPIPSNGFLSGLDELLQTFVYTCIYRESSLHRRSRCFPCRIRTPPEQCRCRPAPLSAREGMLTFRRARQSKSVTGVLSPMRISGSASWMLKSSRKTPPPWIHFAQELQSVH